MASLAQPSSLEMSTDLAPTKKRPDEKTAMDGDVGDDADNDDGKSLAPQRVRRVKKLKRKHKPFRVAITVVTDGEEQKEIVPHVPCRSKDGGRGKSKSGDGGRGKKEGIPTVALGRSKSWSLEKRSSQSSVLRSGSKTKTNSEDESEETDDTADIVDRGESVRKKGGVEDDDDGDKVVRVTIHLNSRGRCASGPYVGTGPYPHYRGAKPSSLDRLSDCTWEDLKVRLEQMEGERALDVDSFSFEVAIAAFLLLWLLPFCWLDHMVRHEGGQSYTGLWVLSYAASGLAAVVVVLHLASQRNAAVDAKISHVVEEDMKERFASQGYRVKYREELIPVGSPGRRGCVSSSSTRAIRCLLFYPLSCESTPPATAPILTPVGRTAKSKSKTRIQRARSLTIDGRHGVTWGMEMP